MNFFSQPCWNIRMYRICNVLFLRINHRMKKYLPYIVGTLLLVGSIALKGIIKRQHQQNEHERREQQRQTSMENLKQSISNREQEQQDNGTTVVIAEAEEAEEAE